jgi:carboxypeptidase C (cathepsin A)
MRRLIAATLLAATMFATPALAQDKDDKGKGPDKAEYKGDVPPPIVSVTHHSGVFGGVKIAYTATASETYLKAEDGTPKAAIFSTSYIKDGPRDPNRPVTFLFNGGPGSGSVWLHMGAFGPKRVAIPSDARDDGAPPYPIVDNPNSLLDVTDIVFIDPVGTGFSHALGKTEAKEYWGVKSDAKSISDFIRIWLSENGRWNAPKYLGGESYGTTRSATVANELDGGYNDVALDGIILISTILDFGAQAEVQGNEMQYVINMPTMAMTAQFHGKAGAGIPPEQWAQQARDFASGPYLSALMKGTKLGNDERASVRKELSRLTGLSETYLDSADLRVTPGRFYKELLRDRRQTVGRLDSRYLGIDVDSAGEQPDNDPSFYAIDGAYTAAINSYARGDLGYKTERQYVTIGGVSNWDWKIGGRDGDGDFYWNVAPYIGRSLRENSGERVFVAAGYYDFATPFMGAEHALSRQGIPGDRVEFHYYGAGHMLYVKESELTAMSRDIRAFIRKR